MASCDTFDIPPIAGFVQKYLLLSKVSVDPFARNKRWASYTNDLNPATAAECHLDALDFLKMLISKSVRADLVIFDPPYSPRQIKECYDGIGLKMKTEDAWRTNGWTPEKDECAKLLTPGGVFLHFGWHTNGIGAKHGFEIAEIVIVAHGSGHCDTLCIAERRVTPAQTDLFKANAEQAEAAEDCRAEGR